MLRSLLAPTFLALLFHAFVGFLLVVEWPERAEEQLDLPPMYIGAKLMRLPSAVAGEPDEEPAIEKTPSPKPKTRPENGRQTQIPEPKSKEIAAEAGIASEAEAVSSNEDPLTVKPDDTVTPDNKNDDLSDLLAAVTDEIGRQAVTNDEQVAAYIGQSQRDIVSLWSRPPSARNGMEAVLRVNLVPTGEVVDVVVARSSGNDAFDRSALTAVERAERFQVPSESLLFEKNFRSFTVLFRPEDLRL